MKNKDFVHLSVHSEFSLYDSLIKVKKYVEECKSMGMHSVCIADDSNMFAAIKLYQSAMSAGMKPIISSEVHVRMNDQVGKVTLIAMNNKGYTNLTEISSLGYEPGNRAKNSDMPIIDFEHIEARSDNLICLSGGREGLIGKAILNGNTDAVREFTKTLRATFPDRFYIELQRIGHSQDNKYNTTAVSLATAAGVPVVATNPIRFMNEEDYAAHEIRIADAKSMTLVAYREQYPESYTFHQHLKSPEEMHELFSDIPSALENTVEIAKRCSVDIDLYVNALPSFPTKGGMSEADFLIANSEEGLRNRLKELFPDKAPEDPSHKEYWDRLYFELDVINQMGFPGYFLIVADFIQWSKDEDIPVGPGRGSGAGSLVAYALKITDLDPLAYSLLFERFLNPERVSMPDFDIDFCMNKRDMVIKYVADKYGHKAVSQIVTFGTLAAKAAIKTSARVQGFPYAVGDRISKLIPNDPGIKLAKVMETQTDFQHVYSSDLDARKIIDRALQLEGIVRQTGKHAGGVVISPSTLTDFTPTYDEANGGNFVSQFDKNDVETAGLVKFDFLGLKTLTIVDMAIKSANKNRLKEGLPPINIEKIPLDDPEVYKMYQKGETTAVFQVESRGMKDLLKRQLPDRFEDIIALVALFRPGPLQSGMVDNFIDRKHGREEISYPDATWQHESLKEILEPTYGIILYQEQVMQIAQVLAGYTLGGADMLRRAMGKKKPEEMQKQRDVFKQGAIENGIDGTLAMKIFDLVEKFAGYGFNKSHSAAYALVSYQTAWLKTHYPAEYMAAVMSADIHDKDKIINFTQEARRLGIEVLPPDINKSMSGFTAESGKIYFGLEAIASFGASYITPILNERSKNGEFKNMFDFASRTKIQKKALTHCINSGAFDFCGVHRASLAASVPKVSELGKQAKVELDSSQGMLFGSLLEDENIAVYEDSDPYSNKEKIINEINAIGVAVSGHLLDDYESECENLAEGKLSDHIEISVEDGNEDNEKQHSVWRDKFVKVVGVISNIQISHGNKTKNGYARMTIDDKTRQLDCLAYNKTLFQSEQFMKENNVVFIKGMIKLDKKSGSYKLVAHELESIDSIRQKSIESLNIVVKGYENDPAFESKMNRFKHDLETVHDQGTCPIKIEYYKTESEVTILNLGNKEYIVDEGLISNAKKIFGAESVKPIFKASTDDKSKSRGKKATREQLEEGAKSRDTRHDRITKALRRAQVAMQP